MEINLKVKYLNAEACQEGDIVEISGEATMSNIKNKEVVNIPVKLNGLELIYTPSIKIIKTFINTYGKESKNWIGKKFQVKIVYMEFNGKEIKGIRPQFLNL